MLVDMGRVLSRAELQLASAVMLALVGCGTVAPNGAQDAQPSDTSSEGHVDAQTDAAAPDGPPPVPQFSSCAGLATTCGPAANENCCATATTVPGGTFYRSYDVASDSVYKDMTKPATVSSFKLDRFEVTVGRFRKFVNAGYGTQAKAPATGSGSHANTVGSGWDAAWNASLPADTTSLVGAVKCNATYQTWTDTAGNNENLPMSCITWYEAMAFCIWDGGYLPTEAEWNYAASGGSEQRVFPWSSPASSGSLDCTYANYETCATGGTGGGAANRVGSESPKGDGRWGQAGLSGNVMEWVLDSYATPYVTPCTDCGPVVGGDRTQRGWSFNLSTSAFQGVLRTGHRGLPNPPTIRNHTIGVRCARSAGS